MWNFIKLLLFFIFFLNQKLVLSYRDPCGVFQIKGNSYDIRPLTKHEDGGYEWKQKLPNSSTTYQWRLNICRNINKAPLCEEDTPAAMISYDGNECVSYLGLVNLWAVDVVPNENNALYWLYLEGQKYEDNKTYRTTRIKLVCDEDAEIIDQPGKKGFPKLTSVVLNTTEHRKYYDFEWKTKYACPINHTISPGSIILIIFFSIVLIYVLGGTVFQFFIRKARGIDVIPNSGFWMDLPFLVKDGFMFMISPITNLIIKDTGRYNTI